MVTVELPASSVLQEASQHIRALLVMQASGQLSLHAVWCLSPKQAASAVMLRDPLLAVNAFCHTDY